jgi:hypothetical protein
MRYDGRTIIDVRFLMKRCLTGSDALTVGLSQGRSYRVRFLITAPHFGVFRPLTPGYFRWKPTALLVTWICGDFHRKS